MDYEDDLDYEDLCRLIREYNYYIQDFDYTNSGEPVCVSEFYNYEYQHIIGANDE